MNLNNETFRNKVSLIRGARKIGPKNQYLISTGLPSLDAILGGGLQLGSIMLIEEDEFGTFAKMVLKITLSEGIVSDHLLFVASQEEDLYYWSSHLPALLIKNEINDPQHDDTDEHKNLNIAWRYNDMPKYNSAPINLNPFSNTYNVTRFMESNRVNNIRYCDLLTDEYNQLLNDIHNVITDENIAKGNNLVRICLHSLGSISWSGNLSLFLYQLRGLIRNEFAVCIVSLPTDLIQNECIIKSCEHMCDVVIKLESLTNKQNPAYNDYNGLVHLIKLPAVNKWNFYKPETANWGFKLKDKQLLIEKIHISPELGENVSREEDVSKEHLPG